MLEKGGLRHVLLSIGGGGGLASKDLGKDVLGGWDHAGCPGPSTGKGAAVSGLRWRMHEYFGVTDHFDVRTHGLLLGILGRGPDAEVSLDGFNVEHSGRVVAGQGGSCEPGDVADGLHLAQLGSPFDTSLWARGCKGGFSVGPLAPWLWRGVGVDRGRHGGLEWTRRNALGLFRRLKMRRQDALGSNRVGDVGHTWA